jgi:hypothetical protein
MAGILRLFEARGGCQALQYQSHNLIRDAVRLYLPVAIDGTKHRRVVMPTADSHAVRASTGQSFTPRAMPTTWPAPSWSVLDLNQHLYAVLSELQILDSQRSQFGTPQCSGEAHQHERAVAQTEESGWHVREHSSNISGQGGCLHLLPGAELPPNPGQAKPPGGVAVGDSIPAAEWAAAIEDTRRWIDPAFSPASAQRLR